MKTIISADRTCDLTEELYAKYGIETIPYHIILGGMQYRDSERPVYSLCQKSGTGGKASHAGDVR